MSLAEELDALPTDDSTPAEKLRQAFELFEYGVKLKRANLVRRNPALDARAIDELLMRWLAREDDA